MCTQFGTFKLIGLTPYELDAAVRTVCRIARATHTDVTTSHCRTDRSRNRDLTVTFMEKVLVRERMDASLLLQAEVVHQSQFADAISKLVQDMIAAPTIGCLLRGEEGFPVIRERKQSSKERRRNWSDSCYEKADLRKDRESLIDISRGVIPVRESVVNPQLIPTPIREEMDISAGD